jgi:hypothetical protein
MAFLVCTVFSVATLGFIIWFSWPPKEDPGISGDWRDWGFPEDPLGPTQPKEDHKLELV